MPDLIDVATLKTEISKHLRQSLGKDPAHATAYDWRMALSFSLRDLVVEPWFESTRQTYERQAKRVYYLSMEFLIGRLIEDVATNLGVEDTARTALMELGLDYDDICADEPDAALGNGGLGRLAACFMDSLSTLGIPAYGYGIRYEHGLFEQRFENGQQVERAETWLAQRHAWEFERPESHYPISFGGHVAETDGRLIWHAQETVTAAAYDTPVIGWGAKWANTLRLWSAKPTSLFDLERFNQGDYIAAGAPETLARTISRVLYPDDTTEIGKELRLKQEYFFTSASIQDILRRFLSEGYDLLDLPRKVAIQLNDTHPAIAGPELVRILVDMHGIAFSKAVEIARSCLNYTNHTLLPEALESWPLGLFGRIFPRHLQIIEAIHQDDLDKTGKAIQCIEYDAVKMGNLAFSMAHHVNGVSALHTELVKDTVFADFHRQYPERIINQTNGVTPRRWLYSCNPGLRDLITDAIGAGWVSDLEQLGCLSPKADDLDFQCAFREVKTQNKVRLAYWLRESTGARIDPAAMFDIQIKRVHEYKRQLLNILETVAYWNELKDGALGTKCARVKIFGGKAAPGYHAAKQIIRLINDVARTINADPETRDHLQIVFPENYNVSMAEKLIPAADLSEQISTAGMEASGTGNMKLSLNGALTIGTLDGANVEIREKVGAENFFLFGLNAQDAVERRCDQGHSRRTIEASPKLSRVLGQIAEGKFSDGDRHRYDDLLHNLYEHDHFLVSSDFESYFETQRVVDAAYLDQQNWAKMAVLNAARMGWFSSDRTINGYADEIWDVQSLLRR